MDLPADFKNLAIQAGVIIVCVLMLLAFFKTIKIIWKLAFVLLIILGLSFALPALREWVFSFF